MEIDYLTLTELRIKDLSISLVSKLNLGLRQAHYIKKWHSLILIKIISKPGVVVCTCNSIFLEAEPRGLKV